MTAGAWGSFSFLDPLAFARLGDRGLGDEIASNFQPGCNPTPAERRKSLMLAGRSHDDIKGMIARTNDVARAARSALRDDKESDQ